MRTTVTLDPDVATEIERIRAREGRRFKHVLNDALRIGLRELSGSKVEEFVSPTRPRDLGAIKIDISNSAQALSLVEGEDRK